MTEKINQREQSLCKHSQPFKLPWKLNARWLTSYGICPSLICWIQAAGSCYHTLNIRRCWVFFRCFLNRELAILMMHFNANVPQKQVLVQHYFTGATQEHCDWFKEMQTSQSDFFFSLRQMVITCNQT